MYIFSISVVYIKEELNCDAVAAHVEKPSDITAGDAQENVYNEGDPLAELIVKKEQGHDYLVSKGQGPDAQKFLWSL